MTCQLRIFICVMVVTLFHRSAQLTVFNLTLIDVANVLLRLATVLHLALRIEAFFDVLKHFFELAAVRRAAWCAVFFPLNVA